MYRQALTLLMLIIPSTQAQNTRPRPPKIKEPHGNLWKPNLIFIRNSVETPKIIRCFAEGYPPPTYKWILNGTEIGMLGGLAASCNSILTVQTDGSLAVKQTLFKSNCDGDFQCIAENSNGRSMTPYLTLKASVLEPFIGENGQPPMTHKRNAYENISLPCKNIPYSSPPLEISWRKRPTTSADKEFKFTVSEDERIVIDPQGTIHFLWLLPEDGDWIYACSGFNSVLQEIHTNTMSYALDINRNVAPVEREPQIMWVKDIVARQGVQVKLLCVFSYYSRNSKMEITWQKNGVTLRNNAQFGRELIIEALNVQVSDWQNSIEGYYTCKANLLGHSETEGRVHVMVIAPPTFLETGRLNDIKAPLGSNANFICKTLSHRSYSKPVVWLLNGEPIAGCIRPKSFECKAKVANGYSHCIDARKRCDSFPDCPDESDEQNCCAEGMKFCNNNCIQNDQKCVESVCFLDGFRCYDKSSCFSASKRCDDIDDCTDRSDELACLQSPEERVGGFTLSGDRTMLTLNNVNIRDNMCVQCMVQNDYGTLFGDGCLTVIDKITMLKEPNSSYLLKPGENVTISVDANTDPLVQTEMKFEWFWISKDDPKIYETLPSLRYPYVFSLSLSNRDLKIVLPNIDENKLSSYEVYRNLTNRQFFVRIGHEYETIQRDFTVWGIEITPPDLNECLELDICKNGGTCINTQGSFFCNCSFEWTGEHCESRFQTTSPADTEELCPTSNWTVIALSGVVGISLIVAVVSITVNIILFRRLKHKTALLNNAVNNAIISGEITETNDDQDLNIGSDEFESHRLNLENESTF